MARSTYRTRAATLSGLYALVGVSLELYGDRLITGLSWFLPETTHFLAGRGVFLVLLSSGFAYGLISFAQRKHALENQRIGGALRALRSSEERFQFAMRGSNDGLWDWDLRSGLVYYAPAWKAMLGYVDDELPERVDTKYVLLHGDDRQKFWDAVQALVDGRLDRCEVELRLRHKDGGYRDILSRIFTVSAANGVCKRLVGSNVDMTERNRVARALRDSERELRLAQAVSRTGSWRIDLDTNALTWFDETYRLFGMAKGSPMSLDLFLQRVHPDDRRAVVAAWEAALGGALRGRCGTQRPRGVMAVGRQRDSG